MFGPGCVAGGGVGCGDGRGRNANLRLVGLQPAWITVCFGRSRAATASLPRAVQPFVVLYRWVCRCSHRQALDETRLSPAAAGLFRASPLRGVQPTVVLYRWVCRPAAQEPGVRSASPLLEDLAPPQRGFFVRVPCAVCNRLWYCIGGFAGQPPRSRVSGRQAPVGGLSPATWRGFFLWPDAVQGWSGLVGQSPRSRPQPL
jgi:hypothetical protein